MDSDNFADKNYFSITKDYIENNIKDQKNIILAPCRANPNFNYQVLFIKKEILQKIWRKKKILLLVIILIVVF